MSVASQLDKLISEYTALQREFGWPKLPRETEWPSRCYLNESDEGELTPWAPVRIDTAIDMFSRLEAALETSIHPDLIEYYTRYWSDPLFFKHPEGELSLLFCWNEEDFERLRANLIGHALVKRKLRQPLTLFFACTEPDAEQFISLDLDRGSIWLEKPGKGCVRQLADSLEEFLSQLSPLPYPVNR